VRASVWTKHSPMRSGVACACAWSQGDASRGCALIGFDGGAAGAGAALLNGSDGGIAGVSGAALWSHDALARRGANIVVGQGYSIFKQHNYEKFYPPENVLSQVTCSPILINHKNGARRHIPPRLTTILGLPQTFLFAALRPFPISGVDSADIWALSLVFKKSRSLCSPLP